MKRYYYTLMALAAVLLYPNHNLSAQSCTCGPTNFEEVNFTWEDASGNGGASLDQNAQSAYWQVNSSSGVVGVNFNIDDPHDRNGDNTLYDDHPYDVDGTCNDGGGGFPNGMTLDPWDSDCENMNMGTQAQGGTLGDGRLSLFMKSVTHLEEVKYRFDFTQEVYVCDLSIWDVDANGSLSDTRDDEEWPGSSFQDEVTFNSSAPIITTLTTNSQVQVSGSNFSGDYERGVNNNCAYTDPDCRVTVSSTTPVSFVEVVYSNGPEDAADEQANPSDYQWWSVDANMGPTNGVSDDHAIGISDFTFCIDPQVELPVELASFSTKSRAGYVELEWTTKSETDNAGFEVQIRENGEFETLGFVVGKGTTTEESDYNFRISDLAGGRYIFRLKQLDFDGRSTLSDEVEAIVALPEGFLLSDAYPNPFNPTTQFTLTIGSEENVEVILYNSFGQNVQTLFSGVMNAYDKEVITINASGLPSGSYYYLVSGETFRSPAKSLVLMK